MLVHSFFLNYLEGMTKVYKENEKKVKGNCHQLSGNSRCKCGDDLSRWCVTVFTQAKPGRAITRSM